jgi:protein-disulfide isomerase
MQIRPVLLGVLALCAAACQSPRPTQTSQQAQTRLDPTLPVAKVKGEVITAAQLEESIQKELKQLDQQYQEQLYQLRKSALDNMIRDRVLEAAAKAQGITVQELVNREVIQKMGPPSEEEMKALYDRAKAGGQPLPPYDEVKPQIERFIVQQKGPAALQAYTEKLQRDASVEVLLPAYVPPKVQVAAVGPSKGPADAPVTIVEFSDFQCPFCARVEPTVAQLLSTYPGKIRLVYRDFPLPNHGDAPKAAEAAHCADDQGKYWEMHERLFANQDKLKVPDLKTHARALGLDGTKFDQCLDSGVKAKLVDENRKAGDEAGVSGTPAFFINGRPLSGAQPLSAFQTIVDDELKGGGKTAAK